MIALAVSLPRFVMCQHITLRLLVHNVNIVGGQVDGLHPVTRRINDYRGASTIPAARDQHRHQAYG